MNATPKTLQNAPGRIGTCGTLAPVLRAGLQWLCNAATAPFARRETPVLANHGGAPESALANAGMPFQVLQDNWIQIPLGDFPHPGPQKPNGQPVYPGGVIQRVDTQAVETLVNEFNSLKGKLGRLFGGVPWFKGHPDMDPETYPDKDAYGWVEAMENHGDQGLFLQVKWTGPGEQLKTSGAYKFYSPVWGFKQLGNDNGKPVLQPTKLFSVGFVNNPNIPVMPLANSADFIPGVEGKLLEQVRALRTELAETKEALANYGTSEGARKGWETRRGNAAAKATAAKVTARTKKAASAPAKAAAKNRSVQAALGARPNYHEYLKARGEKGVWGSRRETDLVKAGVIRTTNADEREAIGRPGSIAKEAEPMGSIPKPPSTPATPPPLPKLGTPEREALMRGSAARSAAKTFSGYDSSKSASEQGGADAHAFMQ